MYLIREILSIGGAAGQSGDMDYNTNVRRWLVHTVWVLRHGRAVRYVRFGFFAFCRVWATETKGKNGGGAGVGGA